MKKYIFLSFLFFVTSLQSQDLTNIAGDLSSSNPTTAVLQVIAPPFSNSDERIDTHAQGFGLFTRDFAFTNKLGPTFNNFSCVSCHVFDGRGPNRISDKPATDLSPRNRGSVMLVRVSRMKNGPDGQPRRIRGAGTQLRDHHIDGSVFYNIRLRWRKVAGSYPDGSTYELRRPRIFFSIPGVKSQRVRKSLRMSPAVVGSGLIEAIPASYILSLADPEDLNNDGISGRVQYSDDFKNGGLNIGRFGFKATHPTVEQQSAAAFASDIGITNPMFNNGSASPELTQAAMDAITFYLQASTVPMARDQSNPDVIAGKNLFQTVGCDDCHRINVVTAGHSLSELNGQTIHPFTDLLLHDMGPGLADKRPEYQADGREWRTTPLWSIGIAERLLEEEGVLPTFLHDGRARTLEEAILWHDGEAATSANNFKNLSAAQRAQLIAFLKSI